MKLQPLRDNVIIRPLAKQEQLKGFFLPEMAEDRSEECLGEIIGVGEGYLLKNGQIIPLEVKVGDWVIFKPYNAWKFKFNKENLVQVSAKELLALASKEVKLVDNFGRPKGLKDEKVNPNLIGYDK